MKKSELRNIIRESIKELREQQMKLPNSRLTKFASSIIRCRMPNTGLALNLTLDGVQPQPGQTFIYANEMYVVTALFTTSPSTQATFNVVNTQSVPSDCCEAACQDNAFASWAHGPSQCLGCKDIPDVKGPNPLTLN